MVELVESAARRPERRRRGSRDRASGSAWSPPWVHCTRAMSSSSSECRAEADFVVVSIFVNPTQFGAGEDFERYPRPLEHDLRRCESAGVDLVFAPSVATVYPHGSSSTFVEVPGLSDVLEGASRPGHFRGVATVVLKLFELVRPDLAIFGQKDYQQQLVIRRMVEDLHVPVELAHRPDRPRGGRAGAQQPQPLSQSPGAPGRRRALSGTRTSQQAVAAGERRAERVRQILRETLESEPLVKLDYAEVADAETLEPLE